MANLLRKYRQLVFVTEVITTAMSQTGEPKNQSRGIKKNVCPAARVQNIMMTIGPILYTNYQATYSR